MKYTIICDDNKQDSLKHGNLWILAAYFVVISIEIHYIVDI